MKINNIVITGRMFQEVQTILEKEIVGKNFRFLSESEVTENDLGWADAFVSFRPSPIFELSHLKWVHSFGAGVDSFLYKREWDERVLLTRTICSFGQKIGEYCLSYILRELQCHQKFNHLKKCRVWEPIAPKFLHEQTVIIYGTGVIGQEIARLFTTLNMTVYGVSLSGAKKDFFRKVYPITGQPPLTTANFVINTLPLTGSTFHIFNGHIFNSLSETIFINVGRGATVSDDALVTALDKGNVKHAVLDVFSEEPLSLSNPYWERKDVTLTPHISALTSPEEAVTCFIETLNKIENGKRIENKVDVKRGF
ncbi:MAG: D-2-hydroxyacid dehydrogenase [Bacillota bacterium]|nr:D-2-hydroxyacid dehydrogenase [Bacillota bacterium]